MLSLFGQAILPFFGLTDLPPHTLASKVTSFLSSEFESLVVSLFQNPFWDEWASLILLIHDRLAGHSVS